MYKRQVLAMRSRTLRKYAKDAHICGYALCCCVFLLSASSAYADISAKRKTNALARYKLGGGLIGYVKSKPLGNGQIISIDVLVIVMIIAVFHRKLI